MKCSIETPKCINNGICCYECEEKHCEARCTIENPENCIHKEK